MSASAEYCCGRWSHSAWSALIVWLRTDDLRLYAWVQFFPCLALPLMLALFAPKYTGTGYWFAAAGFYFLAKLLEQFDSAVYAALRVMSGHPLKHVAAACACYAIYLAFRTRQPMTAGSRRQFVAYRDHRPQRLLAGSDRGGRAGAQGLECARRRRRPLFGDRHDTADFHAGGARHRARPCGGHRRSPRRAPCRAIFSAPTRRIRSPTFRWRRPRWRGRAPPAGGRCRGS